MPCPDRPARVVAHLRTIFVGLLLAVALAAGAGPSGAQDVQAQPAPDIQVQQPSKPVQRSKPGPDRAWQAAREAANANTIYLMAGAPTGTAVTLANDIALILADGPVRVLPVIGSGSSQNISDVLMLKGIDLGLTLADTLEIVSSSGALKGVNTQIRYISVLGISDIHVIAPRAIKRFEELKGRRVAADVEGSGSNLSARYVFDRLGMAVEIVDVDFARSLEMLERGEIDAIYKSEVRPNAAITEVRGDRAADLHLLSVPFDPRLSRAYQPSIIPSGAYPDLAAGAVGTIASPMVLIAYDWPAGTDRYARVAAFVKAFFTAFPQLQERERHASWADVNLAADFPGWRRFPPAEAWIEARRAEQSAAAAPAAPLSTSADLATREAFATFLKNRNGGNLSAAEEEVLFRQFQEWAKTQRQ